MYEKGNSYPSYSHMDQKDLPCAGMFGMLVVRTGGRVDFERIYGEGDAGLDYVIVLGAQMKEHG